MSELATSKLSTLVTQIADEQIDGVMMKPFPAKSIKMVRAACRYRGQGQSVRLWAKNLSADC